VRRIVQPIRKSKIPIMLMKSTISNIKPMMQASNALSAASFILRDEKAKRVIKRRRLSTPNIK